MKNKVLAALMSVCLFAGLAVPAFAITVSSQSGHDSEIKTANFLETSYTVKNEGKKALAGELRAYASTKQLVQNPYIEWSIENEGTDYAFTIDNDGTVFASEDKGTATVIATLNEKVIAKTKVVAAKATNIKATGFKFKNASETILTGADAIYADAQEIKIVPTPADSKFTADQMSYLKERVEAAIDNGEFNIVGKSAGGDATVTPNKSDIKVTDEAISIVYAVPAAATTERQTTYTFDTTATFAADSVKFANIATKFTLKTGADAAAVAASLKTDINADTEVAKKWDVTTTGTGSTMTGTITVTFEAKTSEFRYADPGAVTVTKAGATAFASFNKKAVVEAVGAASDVSTLINDKIDAKSREITAPRFPNPNNSSNESNIRRALPVGAKMAVVPNAINAAGSKTVQVGEKFNVVNLFKQSPSKANIKFTESYDVDYVDQNATINDFAVMLDANDPIYSDKGDAIGVAVGRNKITATITIADGTTKSASVVINVVEKGTTPTTPDAGDAALSFSVGTTAVGGAGFTISIKNAPEGAAITYKSMDEKIATVDASGKVTGVSAGTTKIEVNVNGAKLYCTVTVKAAAGGNTGTIPPATGVAVLAPLF